MTTDTTSKGTKLLNAVQAFIIDFANSKRISLQDEFATVEDFKQFVIGITFKTLTETGVSVEEAFDVIFGTGEYQQLVADVWNTLNKGN